MKYLASLIVGLLFQLPRVAFAQAATTPAEYDLGSRGVAEARATGHALPNGYALSGAASTTTGQFTITVEDLVREPNHELAAIVIKMQHPNWTTPRYLCLPNATSEAALKQQYLTQVIALTPNNTQALATALALRLSTLRSEQRY